MRGSADIHDAGPARFLRWHGAAAFEDGLKIYTHTRLPVISGASAV
jgi:hypothetical protein